MAVLYHWFSNFWHLMLMMPLEASLKRAVSNLVFEFWRKSVARGGDDGSASGTCLTWSLKLGTCSGCGLRASARRGESQCSCPSSSPSCDDDLLPSRSPEPKPTERTWSLKRGKSAFRLLSLLFGIVCVYSSTSMCFSLMGLLSAPTTTCVNCKKIWFA